MPACIDPRILRELLEYDPQTGLFVWKPRAASHFKNETSCKRWNANFANKPALTSDNGSGYRQGTIFEKLYYAHRIAWALYYGEWPTDQIDHVNGNRSDNRISNLRAVTKEANGRNAARRKDNASGVTGVYWSDWRNKWQAYIRLQGKKRHLGYFNDIEAAASARKVAERENGYHPNHGRTA
jgi:hypothetical protein